MPVNFTPQPLPEPIEQQYLRDPRVALAIKLQQQDYHQRPIYSPWQGVARALQQGIGAYQGKKLREEYQGQADKRREALAKLLSPQDEPTMQNARGETMNVPQQSMADRLIATGIEEYQMAGLKMKMEEQEAMRQQQAAMEKLKAEQEYNWREHTTPTGTAMLNEQGEMARWGTPSANVLTQEQGQMARHATPSGSSLAESGAIVDAANIAARAQMKEFGKQTGEEQAKSMENAIKGIPRAQGLLGRAEMADKAIDAAGYMGPGAKGLTEVKKFGAAIGVNKAPTAENLVDFVNKEWTAAMQFDEGGNRVLAGQMSDSDRKFFEERAVSLGDDKTAAKIKNEIFKREAKKQIEIGKLALKHRNNPDEFERARQEYISKNPTFDESMQKKVDSALGVRTDSSGIKFLGFE